MNLTSCTHTKTWSIKHHAKAPFMVHRTEPIQLKGIFISKPPTENSEEMDKTARTVAYGLLCALSPHCLQMKPLDATNEGDHANTLSHAKDAASSSIQPYFPLHASRSMKCTAKMKPQDGNPRVALAQSLYKEHPGREKEKRRQPNSIHIHKQKQHTYTSKSNTHTHTSSAQASSVISKL